MNSMDSVVKVITRYFATLTKEPFTFMGSKIAPRRLLVSPMLLRGVDCPSGCGACCRRFTLDWLPSERGKLLEHGYKMKFVRERLIEFNGKEIPILSDIQGHGDYFCRNLNPENGRCGIHLFSPFSCDFELIRTFEAVDDNSPNRLSQQLFGRGWNMTRITDGKKGAMCSMLPVTPDTVASVVRRMKRFQDWANHFGLKNTWAPEVIELVEHGGLARASGPVLLDPFKPKGFGL